MAAEFLGKGWRFPIRPDAAGGLGYVDGDDNVEQSLRLVLMTRLGARVMRPDFGSGAGAAVFAPGSVRALRDLEKTVRDAIRDWEPRVAVLDVAAETNPADETRVTVNIEYRVRRTNSKQNLVFPFYLGVGVDDGGGAR